MAVNRNSSVRISPLCKDDPYADDAEAMEYIQLWNGTKWENWKPTNLGFDGYYVKNGLCSEKRLSAGFTNTTTVSASCNTNDGRWDSGVGAHYQTMATNPKNSANKDIIDAAGYETIQIGGNYSLSGVSNYSSHYNSYVGMAYSEVQVNILNGQTGALLETIFQDSDSCLGSGTGYSRSGNFNKSILLSDYNTTKLKIQIVAIGGSKNPTNSWDGGGTGRASITLKTVFAQ